MANNKKSKMYVDRNFTVGKVSDMLFGSFIEHLGKVYTGIYEPGHRSERERF